MISLYIALSRSIEGARNETFITINDTLRIEDDNYTRSRYFVSIQNHLSELREKDVNSPSPRVR